MILRASISLLALSAALAAQAFDVSLVSIGNFDDSDPSVLTQDETVVGSFVTPLPPLATLHVDITFVPFTTVARYLSPNGTLTLNLLYNNTETGSIGSSTDSGTWNVAGGTGAYAGYQGGGSYSINYNSNNNNFAQTTVVGDLEAVPEPASMIALSLGAAAMLRRRKKA